MYSILLLIFIPFLPRGYLHLSTTDQCHLQTSVHRYSCPTSVSFSITTANEKGLWSLMNPFVTPQLPCMSLTYFWLPHAAARFLLVIHHMLALDLQSSTAREHQQANITFIVLSAWSPTTAAFDQQLFPMDLCYDRQHWILKVFISQFFKRIFFTMVSLFT